jgi:hypothetical protein
VDFLQGYFKEHLLAALIWLQFSALRVIYTTDILVRYSLATENDLIGK